MKQLPAPTAKNINDAHQCARESAENAVEWAIKCGQLLVAKKEELKHGEFQVWIEKNCDFAYSTAARYMKASQNSTAVEISSLSRLFPSGTKPKAIAPKGAVSVLNPKGGRTTAAKEGTEETGADRPADPVSKPIADDRGAPAPKAETPVPDITGEHWVPDDDEDEKLALAEKEYSASIDKVMESDDKLVTARAEIKRQAAEIAALRVSRDGYMNGKLAVTKLLKAEQRKVDRLNAELEKLRQRAA